MTQRPDDDTIREFEQKGATVLRGVFSDWVETLRSGIAANMDDPAPNARIYKGEAGGGRFFVDYCNWARFGDYERFIRDSPAAEIGAALMGSDTVQLFHEHVLVKEAATGVPTPWHQDAPYYCVDCAQTVSIWVPLDPVPRATTLEFIAGSHKWGKSYRPQRFDGTALNENDGLEAMPDIDGNRGDYDIIGWATRWPSIIAPSTVPPRTISRPNAARSPCASSVTMPASAAATASSPHRPSRT